MPDAPSSQYRITAMGGSATECLYLDDPEAWPALLMNRLNGAQQQRRVWVGNAGASGHTTVHHRWVIDALPLLGSMDLLIFLVGINDLQDTLAFEGGPTDAELDRFAAEFVQSLRPELKTSPSGPSFSRLKVFQKLRSGLNVLKRPSQFQSDAHAWYSGNRRKRARHATLPLPDLSLGLSEFRARIARLQDQCRLRHVRCVFLTQPTMWRGDLTASEQRLLWFGWIGRVEKPKGYASPGELERAMQLYNRALIESCEQNGSECFDLASFVPKDTSALFDDCHFNIAGSHRVAALIAEYLLKRPPFSDASRSPTSTRSPLAVR